MKPHVLQTITDLEHEAEYLNQMISVLRKYGETAPTAPLPTEQHPQTPAADNEPPSRRRVSTERKVPDYHPKSGVAVKQVVIEAIAELEEPFTLKEIRAWIQKHRKPVAARMGHSSLSVAIFNLRQTGLVRDAGKKDGLNAYKRSQTFHVPTKPSQVEQAYRELRAEVKVPEEVA